MNSEAASPVKNGDSNAPKPGGISLVDDTNPLTTIKPDTWYNIPIPLVDAIKKLKEHCLE